MIFVFPPSMVQRKAPRKLAHATDASRSAETADGHDSKSNGRGEIKTKMRKSRSLRSKAILNRSPPKIKDSWPEKPPAGAKPPTGKASHGSPNYMKSTSSWDARKEGLQVTAYSSAITVAPNGSKVTNHSSHLKSSPPSFCSPAGMNSSGPKNARKPLARKASLRLRRPSMKRNSAMALSSKEIVNKATCSSTLKDSKFQKTLDLNPGTAEIDRTSVMRVCPFNYCSLNGHRHEHATPLKRFLSARRRSLKAQKSMRVKRQSSARKSSFRKGREETDAGKRSVSRVKSKMTPLVEDVGVACFVQIYAKPAEHAHKLRGSEDSEAQDALEEEISRILHDLYLMDGSCEGETTEYDEMDSLDDIAEVCSMLSFGDGVDQNSDKSLEGIDAAIDFLGPGSKEENFHGIIQEGWGVECCGVNVLENIKKCLSDAEDSIIFEVSEIDYGDEAKTFPHFKNLVHLMTDTSDSKNDTDDDMFKDEERMEVDVVANCNVKSSDLLDHPTGNIFLNVSLYQTSSETKEFGDKFKVIEESTLNNNVDKCNLSQCRYQSSKELECMSGAKEDNGVISGSKSASREPIVDEESTPVVGYQSQERIILMINMDNNKKNYANAEDAHGIIAFGCEKGDKVNINIKTNTDNDAQEIEFPEFCGVGLDKSDITAADKSPGQIKPNVSSEDDENDDACTEDENTVIVNELGEALNESLHNINADADIQIQVHNFEDKGSTKEIDFSEAFFGVHETDEKKAVVVDRCNYITSDVSTGNSCPSIGSGNDEIQGHKIEYDNFIFATEFCQGLIEEFDIIQDKQNSLEVHGPLNGAESVENINPNADVHKEYADHNTDNINPIMKSTFPLSFCEEFDADPSKLIILETCNLVRANERPESSKLRIASVGQGNDTTAENEIGNVDYEDNTPTRELKPSDSCYEVYKEEKEKSISPNNHNLYTTNEISNSTDLIIFSEEAEDENSTLIIHHDCGSASNLRVNSNTKENEILGGKEKLGDIETPCEELEAACSPSKAYIAYQVKPVSHLECDTRDNIISHIGDQDEIVGDFKSEDVNIILEIHSSESYSVSYEADQGKLEVRPLQSGTQIKDVNNADLSDTDSLLDNIEHAYDIYSESSSNGIQELIEDMLEDDDSHDLEGMLSANVGFQNVFETMSSPSAPLEKSIKQREKHKIMRRRTSESVEAVKLINPRFPSFLTVEPYPDAEKVDLRHQMMDERKNSEAWMIDHALQKVVRKLAPARKKKVLLLVEAFEAVIPPTFCESPLQSPASRFSRPIQACF